MPDVIKHRALLQSDAPPSEEQKRRFTAFIRRAHGFGEDVPLEWERVPELSGGFRLYVDQDVYDWSLAGRMRQFQERMAQISPGSQDVLPLLRDAMESFHPGVVREERGEVLSVSDGIARVQGLPDASYGEILEFDNGIRGMIQDLREDSIGCVLFGEDAGGVTAGSYARCTGRTAGMPVGIRFLGRVVDALGRPIDGKGAIPFDGYRPIELPAPGILERQPVDKPMETGILCIDSMFPIGRGQRELIIGDRQTGKTAIAVDTILNQKDRNVLCIYVAVGQKSSAVAQLAANLERLGAMDYSIIINAPASAPASEQYIAPYAGCALGEHFMYMGRDVLIIYDDLSKHAIAYRTLSLLLERSPGREAFPGDVFYLHSRLLERSAHLSDDLGGGSLTALPIIETQSGDVSAYIPTNVISITDGQIYLESSLFFSGQRPAVNVGLSVSRVGGDAQTQAMKRSSGALRLDLAQYREMEVFTQFASDLDDTTKRQLIYGQGLMRLLRQNQNSPLRRHAQVTLLTAALSHSMETIPLERLDAYRVELVEAVEQRNGDICTRVDRNGKLTDEDRERLLETVREFAVEYLDRIAQEHTPKDSADNVSQDSADNASQDSADNASGNGETSAAETSNANGNTSGDKDTGSDAANVRKPDAADTSNAAGSGSREGNP